MASGGSLVKNQHFDITPEMPSYMVLARETLGIREAIRGKGGRARPNPEVMEYSEITVGVRHNSMRVPWCAFWLGAMLELDGITSSKSGMARSYLRWGEEVEEDDFRAGDVVVTWRGSHDNGINGHVFFLLSWNKSFMYGIGGNQGDTVSIQKFRRSKVLGVRRYRPLTKSKTALAATGSAGTGIVSQTANAAIPEPGTLDQVAKATKEMKGPLQDILSSASAYKAEIVLVFGLVSVGLALYALWRRRQDYKRGKNT